MRFYGMRSGRNNMPRLLARSYMYNSRKSSTNQYKNSKITEEKSKRLQNNAIKAQQKADKAAYRVQQMELTEEMSKDIAEKYKRYFEISQKEYLEEDFFDLINLKREYHKIEFIYDEPKPIRRNPIVEQAVLLKVPKEKFLEKIFPTLKDKRMSIIKENEQRIQCVADKNKQHEIDEIQRFNECELAYQLRMEEMRLLWEHKEREQELEILAENKRIDDWISACENNGNDAIMDFIEAALSVENFEDDFLTNREISYNEKENKVIIDLHIKKRDDIFYADSYRYMPRNEEIRAVKMKVSTANEMLKKLLIELCLHTFIVLFNSALSEKFKMVTLNIYSEDICYASSSIDKASYDEYNLITFDDKDAFTSRHINLFNNFNKGVTAIETLFVPIKEMN